MKYTVNLSEMHSELEVKYTVSVCEMCSKNIGRCFSSDRML